MKDNKYFTKQILIEYNNAAIRENRNRAIKEEVLEELPENGIFPVVIDFYHPKDEIRVRLALDEKRTVFIDMSQERYYMLPVAKWNDERQEYSFEDEKTIRERFPYKNREWTQKVVKKPYRRQGPFRRKVLKAYNNTCAVCEIKEPKILRASHIVPVSKGGSDEVENGLCLCANHEIAFDKGLIKIQPNGVIQVLSDEIKELRSEILYPADKSQYPSKQYLKMKYDNKYD